MLDNDAEKGPILTAHQSIPMPSTPANRELGLDIIAARRSITQVARTIDNMVGTHPSIVLTAREQEVAALVVQGMSNRQISQALSISPNTVALYIAKIVTKADLTSSTQIAAWISSTKQPEPIATDVGSISDLRRLSAQADTLLDRVDQVAASAEKSGQAIAGLKRIRKQAVDLSELLSRLARHLQGADVSHDLELARRVVKYLRKDFPAPDVSALDLSEVELSLDELAGAVWSKNTRWPSQEISSYVRDASDEIATGVYRVRTGTEQYVTAP